MATFNKGDRIRAITFHVEVQPDEADEPAVTHIVTLRYGWYRPKPTHACVANECTFCKKEAGLKAIRRIGGRVASVYAVRDRQAIVK